MSEQSELRVARMLTGGEPLSLRELLDGGMCVIAADGRNFGSRRSRWVQRWRNWWMPDCAARLQRGRERKAKHERPGRF